MFGKGKYKTNSLCFKKAAVAILLVVLFVVSMASAPVYIAESARVTQTQIDRLKAEKREYERRKREVQSKINAMEFERLAEMQKKKILDERIHLTALEIKNINKTIEQFYQLIREKEYEVFLAQNREDDQFSKYRSRVRDMEENGIVSYLELIFDAVSFSDLLARIDFISDIMRSDKKMFDDLQAARIETEENKADLEETKAELENEKEQLESKEAELLEQLEEAHEFILRLEDDLAAEGQLRDELIADENRVQREIRTAEAQLQRQREEEERRKREEQQRQQQAQQGTTGGGSSGGSGSGAVSGSGQLGWPVPGGRIISRWGASRGNRSHQGLDISGAHGANVVAAASGTVITNSYGSGYGYYVTISHGNGLSTLYSHLSSSAVNVGDTVSKGQVVGYVGSTGNATTPHLHFEVFVNGVRVNPERWL